MILDYIWFLIKIIGSATILLFICSVFLAVFSDLMHKGEERKRKIMLENAIEEALKRGDFEMGIIDNRKDEEKNSKKD